MTAGRQAFLEKYTALWSERAAACRASGAHVDLAIAGALDRIVAPMRAELLALPPAEAEPIAVQEPVADTERITWRSPCFIADGRHNIFAGTLREEWLASASSCDDMGYHDVAADYRRMAAEIDPHVTRAERAEPIEVVRPRRAASRRGGSTWTGMPMPPPEPTPFAAGPQMDMFA